MMRAAMNGLEPEPGLWQEAAVETLCQRLADPDGSLVASVVDKPDGPGELAACAVGVIECRLGGLDNPSGEIGYVFQRGYRPGLPQARILAGLHGSVAGPVQAARGRER
jgi:hypothetical protein